MEKFHGLRSLMGYSPWGHKELHMTEHAHMRKKKLDKLKIYFQSEFSTGLSTG